MHARLRLQHVSSLSFLTRPKRPVGVPVHNSMAACPLRSHQGRSRSLMNDAPQRKVVALE
jgi:hypothetical protein